MNPIIPDFLASLNPIKIKVPNYYGAIPRLGDTRNINLINFVPIDITPSNFHIASAHAKYDNMVAEIIDNLNTKLKQPIHVTTDNILGDLEALIASSEGDKIKFKAVLLKDGNTAVLTKVASRINTTSIAQSARAVLSKEGIFFYLAYRAIKGNDITDVEGIISQLLKSVSVIKTYINRELVNIVISNEGLSIDNEKLSNLKDVLQYQQFSYERGAPTRYIVKAVKDLKSTGDLPTMVLNFLDENQHSFSRDMNKRELANRMLKYLRGIGYKPQKTSFQRTDSYPTVVKPNKLDKLHFIEGIGEKNEEALHNAGIYTFNAIANLEEEELENIKGITLIQANAKYIIEQALLITQAEFDKLKKLQEKK